MARPWFLRAWYFSARYFATAAVATEFIETGQGDQSVDGIGDVSTPSHATIGGGVTPPPRLPPLRLLPIVGQAASGQGSQRVTAAGDLALVAAISAAQAQSSEATAEQALMAALTAGQGGDQQVKLQGRLALRARAGSGQGGQSAGGAVGISLAAKGESGWQEQEVPSYSGDPLPEIFLAA